MSETEKINAENLEEVSGGNDNGGYWRVATPNVQSGYLAIRSKPINQESNELAPIYPGSIFRINMDRWNGTYVWSSYKAYKGWVNSDFITVL